MLNFNTHDFEEYEMLTTYTNEYGEWDYCIQLSCPIIGNLALIQFEDGDRGYCSTNLLHS